MGCVLYEVGTELLNIVYVTFVFGGLHTFYISIIMRVISCVAFPGPCGNLWAQPRK